MFIFYALFYLSDSLNNKHVSFTLSLLLTFSLAAQLQSLLKLTSGFEDNLPTKYIHSVLWN